MPERTEHWTDLRSAKTNPTSANLTKCVFRNSVLPKGKTALLNVKEIPKLE